MTRIGIFYATRHGHTPRVADYIAREFRERNLETDVWAVVNAPDSLDVARYDVIIVAASVHAGRHEPEMVRFVRQHRAEISRAVNALVTVTLTQANAENADVPSAEREKAAADVVRMTRQFVDDTGWHPQRILPVAGALMYTKYGWWMKQLMKWIARRAGASTDTSRDHVYTDWAALNTLAATISTQVQPPAMEASPTG